MKSKVLDVACGPGWTSHFLAKLGYYAFGIDISKDLISLAKKRVSLDKLAPYKETDLTADFAIHDIEENPLDIDMQFDCAFFESALHHFYDPITVIRHISANLRQDGILCICEAVAPKSGSPEFSKNMDIMSRYNTLERPYTRDQLLELLSICDYGYYEFISRVNGLFNPRNENDIISLNNQLSSGDNRNICIASRTSEFFIRKGREATFPPSSFHSSSQVKKKLGGLEFAKLLWCALVMRSREEYVSMLYNLILSREADSDGLAHYLGRPDSFIYRLKMVRSFINSEERKNLIR